MTFPAPAGSRLTTALINHAYSLSDTNVTTVTSVTTATDLSSVYQIPAGDAYAGLRYKLEAWGNGTWGTTAHALTFWTALGGTALGQGSNISSGLFGVSQIFRWEAAASLICVSTGTSGTWKQMTRGTISVYNGPIQPGTTADQSASFTDSLTSAATQDTTVANDFSIQATWGAGPSGSTISCQGTTFTRCG